ncbi:hypothetical protein FRC01_010486 [Tulasnella sp. 417]|nr:hypothetical protein FRC01_010486 [Tulasnella sp. 417]
MDATTDSSDKYVFQDDELPPPPTGNSRTFPSVPKDSHPSNLLSKYDPVPVAALRAGTRGETSSAECQAPSFQVEVNVGRVAAPVPSQHSPSVLSSNVIRDIERHERPQSRDLILAYNVELSDALFQQQSEEVSTMLSTAGVAQARRRRMRATTVRARRMAGDIAITEVDLANLGAAFLAGLADDDDDDDDTSVNNEVDTDMSASDEAGASSAVAPLALNSPSHQSSTESTIVTAPSDVQATPEPLETTDPLESDEGDLSGLYSQFRDSWAPPAPLSSLFEENDIFFSPPLRGEITGELSQIRDAFESERVEEEFSLPYLNVLVAAGPADKGDSERDRTPSAGDEVHALSTVAPGAPNSPSHEITEFDLVNVGTAFLAGEADDHDASVNNEVDMSQSASNEAVFSCAAAPVALNSPSHQRSAESTVATAPSDLQTTTDAPETNDALGVEGVDPSCLCSPWRDSCDSSAPLIPLLEDDTFFSPLLRGELDLAAFAQNGQPTINSADVASERFSYDPALQSVSIANADNHSPAGSAETDARLVQRDLDTSAVDEARSSSFVATPQPTAVWHMEPVGIVVQLTPPSPTNTIKPSESNRLAQRRETNRSNSGHQPMYRGSPLRSDGLGLVGQQPGMLAVPSFRKRSRRRRMAESSQPEDVVARSSRRGSDLPLGLVETNTDAGAKPIYTQGFSTSPPNAETVPISGSPSDSVKRSSPSTSQIGGAPFRSAKTGVKLCAAGEAEPSSSAAPTRSPAVLRKARKVKTVATHPVRHQPRSSASRITTRLREWGTRASRFFSLRRSVRVEENGTGNPYFDPWEGFVPPRAPSPETSPDDDLAAGQSNIWNIYAKID